MDESKPPIPHSKFRLSSAFRRTSADVDIAPLEFTNSGELGVVESQSRSQQVELSRNAPSDGSSVAVYCQNEEEVREGFIIALRAMGVAVIEPPPEPAKSSVRGAKP